MAEQQALPGILKPTREQRMAEMDSDILDVGGAAKALGVSTRTIYNLARKGEIPAMRVGREWRFARENLVEWVAVGSQNEQLATMLKTNHVRSRK